MRIWNSSRLRESLTTKRQRTVRYASHVAVLTALMIGLAAAITQDASYIAITTEPSKVSAGEEFTIVVNAQAHTPINAVDITVRYPEDLIDITGIDTGTSVITLWTQEPYAKDGVVYLRGGVFQRGFLGEHPIARIRAKAVRTGVADVQVGQADLVAGDGKGTVVTAKTVDENKTKIIVGEEARTLTGDAVVAFITDIDGSGGVDLTDISVFMSAWFSKGKTFDFNNDGRMTFRDFSILLSDSFFK